MIRGSVIKRERCKRGLSQEQLGEMIHVSKVSICGYEKGTKKPTLENLINLLEVLDLKVEDVFDEKYTMIRENEIPYGSKFSETDQELIEALRKCPDLYISLCQNIDKLDEIKLK